MDAHLPELAMAKVLPFDTGMRAVIVQRTAELEEARSEVTRLRHIIATARQNFDNPADPECRHCGGSGTVYEFGTNDPDDPAYGPGGDERCACMDPPKVATCEDAHTYAETCDHCRPLLRLPRFVAPPVAPADPDDLPF